MTRNEKQLLRTVIKKIIRYDKEEWWLLKRQIFDFGYQSHYDAEGSFIDVIDREVFNLQPDVKHALIVEWNSANPKRNKITYASFHSAYRLLILEEIVERARIGAMRTVNWYD